MNGQNGTDTTDRDQLVAALKELIDALDRRVPHAERVGEIRNARDASVLTTEALTRIEEVRRADLDRQMRDSALDDLKR